MKERLNNKGFTLMELLAVIAILGILIIIAIPSMSKVLDSSSKKAFYVSVNNVVESVRISVIQNDTTNCLYDYKIENGTDANIQSLTVWVHQNKKGKTVYSVIAKRDGSKTVDIDIEDFSETTTDSNTWIGTNAKKYSTNFKNVVTRNFLKSLANPESNALSETLKDLSLCDVE